MDCSCSSIEMEEKLQLNLSFTKITHPNYCQPTCNFCPPPPALSPSSVIIPAPYINMPSTPSSSSFSPSSPSPSPSTALPSPNDHPTFTHAHHDLPLHPPTPVPTSSACAACKYQRRKCGNECMLAPYFPPERQQDFQNAHRLFGVSNIVKKLRGLSPSQRQLAVDTMVYEANMHAANPSGGCYSVIMELQSNLEFLLKQLQDVQKRLAHYKGKPVNFDTDPQLPLYADQSRSSFVSLDNVNPGQHNQGSEEQQHDYFYFDGNLIDERNNNNSTTDIGSHDIASNYLNNDYNHTEVEQEADRDEIRPFMDILPNCSDSEEGEEQLVCKSSVDMSHMASLNSALDKSTQCSLGLGFSAY